MSLHASIDFIGLLHHVVRDIESRPIFLEDQDRERFLDRFFLSFTGKGHSVLCLVPS